MFAAVANNEWDDALESATVCDRNLSAFEKGQVRMMADAIKRKFDMSPAFELTTAPPPRTGRRVALTTSAAVDSTKVKLKLSQIIDQGADHDCEMLPMPEFMNYRRKFGDMTGDAQLEKEEVTDAQLSCLKAKLELGQAPFVDMGAWGAYGGRMHSESQEVHVTDAERQSLESSQVAWCFEVGMLAHFRTASIILSVAIVAVLEC